MIVQSEWALFLIMYVYHFAFKLFMHLHGHIESEITKDVLVLDNQP